MNLDDLWKTISGKLKAIIDAHSYSMWIEPIKPLDATGDTLVLEVDNDFACTWVKENYLPLMTQVLSAALPAERRKIELRVAAEAAPIPPPAPPKQSATASASPAGSAPKRKMDDRQRRMIGALNDNFTFDEFVVGPSNS